MILGARACNLPDDRKVEQRGMLISYSLQQLPRFFASLLLGLFFVIYEARKRGPHFF